MYRIFKFIDQTYIIHDLKYFMNKYYVDRMIFTEKTEMKGARNAHRQI